MRAEKKIRVLVAKPGLDGHETGAKLIARVLRDAGMEVVYTGFRQTAETIVNAALQEDVDVVGLSILSGAHNELCSRIVKALHGAGLDDVLIVAGGIIPAQDVAALKRVGVHGVFGPGSDTRDIVAFIRAELPNIRARFASPPETAS